ncbi:hypothetical protein [Trinickia violacea]|nr:hypothetical protein [Trinickia violacea]
MQYALLVSELPHIQEARAHYDSLLTLHSSERSRIAPLGKWWAAVRARFC